ncbi:MAG: hypothetical protein WAX04_11235, partial [Oscillospiraceae bacterium]
MKKLMAIVLVVLLLSSCTNKINRTPEGGTLPDLEESSSSDVAAIAQKETPTYPVFENTDWGMTQDEVLSALSLTKSDW